MIPRRFSKQEKHEKCLRIVEAVKSGAFANQAMKAFGISYSTYKKWILKRTCGKCGEFFREIEQLTAHKGQC